MLKIDLNVVSAVNKRIIKFFQEEPSSVYDDKL